MSHIPTDSMTIDTSKEAVEWLLDGVTPGPWRVGPVDDCRVEDADGNEVAQIDGDYNSPDLWPKMEANARFIAAARELVPALAAERDEQTARADAAGAEVARLTAELSALRAGQYALVAAVCDVAASMIEDNMRHAAELGREIWPIPDIRALTTADATAALEAKLRVERNKALRDAADQFDDGVQLGNPRAAILAMIEPEGK